MLADQRVGFVGLGNMGLPMAKNLGDAGCDLIVYDVAEAAREAAGAAGLTVASDLETLADHARIIITMLPAGQHVEAVYCGAGRVLDRLGPGSLVIDCSTIDVETARAVAAQAQQAGIEMLDAPVSGGVAGATGGTLTFMVGGAAEAFEHARPLLSVMGKNILHAGPAGNGQAAKICNNMILGISMIAVSEAFALAKSLGLDAQTLFDISSTASGQCWSLTSYCPEPGPVPSSPANRDYTPGFTTAMMLKDLTLAKNAAIATETRTPLGSEAYQLYSLFAQEGNEDTDFSAIIKMLKKPEGDRSHEV